MSPRTLLVDDNTAFLKVAGRYLAAQPVTMIGLAHDGLAALALCEKLNPDLVLLDLELSHTNDMNGMAVLCALKLLACPPRVIIVTLHDQDEYREAARQAGADGFISKHEFATALAPLIHRLFNHVDLVDLNNTTK